MKAWSILFLTLALEPALTSCLPVISKSEAKGTSPISRSRPSPDDDALEYVTLAIPKSKNRHTDVYVEDDAVEDEELDIPTTSTALDTDSETDADADTDATADADSIKASPKIKPATIVPPQPPPEYLAGKVQKPFKSPVNPFLGGDNPTTPNLANLKSDTKPLTPPPHLKISNLTPLPPIRTAATSIPSPRQTLSRPLDASLPSTSLKPISPPKPHPKAPTGSSTIHSHAAELKRRSTENFNSGNPAFAPNKAPRSPVKRPKTKQLGVVRNMQVQSHGFPELKKRGLDGHPEDVERERRRGGIVPLGSRAEEGLSGAQYKMRRKAVGDRIDIRGVRGLDEEKREMKGSSRIMKRDGPVKKKGPGSNGKRKRSQGPQGYSKNPKAAWRRRDL